VRRIYRPIGSFNFKKMMSIVIRVSNNFQVLVHCRPPIKVVYSRICSNGTQLICLVMGPFTFFRCLGNQQYKNFSKTYFSCLLWSKCNVPTCKYNHITNSKINSKISLLYIEVKNVIGRKDLIKNSRLNSPVKISH
jgi:hypothetical protein